MIEAAKCAKATIVADVFHEFNPHGISGVVVIAESHIAIHSWPEFSCASVDIFTCSADMNPEAAIEYLKTAFKAQKTEVRKINRGVVGSDILIDEVTL
jgi:S-adenosylmethionine decarboxylase